MAYDGTIAGRTSDEDNYVALGKVVDCSSNDCCGCDIR